MVETPRAHKTFQNVFERSFQKNIKTLNPRMPNVRIVTNARHFITALEPTPRRLFSMLTEAVMMTEEEKREAEAKDLELLRSEGLKGNVISSIVDRKGQNVVVLIHPKATEEEVVKHAEEFGKKVAIERMQLLLKRKIDRL